MSWSHGYQPWPVTTVAFPFCHPEECFHQPGTEKWTCNSIISLFSSQMTSKHEGLGIFFPHFCFILSFQRVQAAISHVAFILHHDCQHLKENLKLPSTAINCTGCCMAGWALYRACVSPAKTKGIKNCVEMKALHFWLLTSTFVIKHFWRQCLLLWY